jgi:N-methylhydantoinase B
LAPFETLAPTNSIVNAIHPAPVALRHVIGHFIPDTIFNALNKILPNSVPTEGAGTLCNFHVSTRPQRGLISEQNELRTEILTFNSGGSGARPTSDGLNATAFPSGVMTMPVEATENTGPIIIWRKELRPDSGGIGKFRGGLGQFMEVGVAKGHEFDFQAMLDRVDHQAKGQKGGGAGAPTLISQDDGLKMKGKGKQFVPSGRKVMLAFPGGGGFGNSFEREKSLIKKDLKLGYISKKSAKEDYGLSQLDIDKLFDSKKNN